MGKGKRLFPVIMLPAITVGIVCNFLFQALRLWKENEQQHGEMVLVQLLHNLFRF